MKKTLCSLIFVSHVLSGVAYASAFAKFMDIKDAQQRWGSGAFDAEKFRKGDEKTRASMAVDLIKSRLYIGKDFPTVEKELGRGDGYFESNSVPAYMIEEKKKPAPEAWQIVFLPDKTGNHVGDTKIHKNCCDAY
jgi:hypothetical protein